LAASIPVPSWRNERRLATFVAASVVQVALLLALGAWHIERAREPGGETVLNLLPIAPAAPRKRPVPTPTGRPRPASGRAAMARSSLLPPPLPVDVPSARTVAPESPSSAPQAPADAPEVPLDLGVATLHRAIVQAAQASGSVAAQAGQTTRPAPAQQRAQAIEQAKIDDCRTPEGQGKPSKSGIQLGGLSRLPGLLVDAAAGKCSLK